MNGRTLGELTAIINSPSNNEFLKSFLKEGYSGLTNEYDNYLSEFQRLSKDYAGNIPDSTRLRMEIYGNEIRQSKHEYLYKYAKSNPDSYVSVWIAVDLFLLAGTLLN
ncbi:MAG: hypothetical protein ACK4E8_10250 [Lacibacter sp.]